MRTASLTRPELLTLLRKMPGDLPPVSWTEDC
jgi:hypothetical protein